MSVRLHAPRAEVTTKDTAIDRIELSADGFQTQADTVLTTSATFEYSGGSGLRGGVSGPLGGERASFGQSATASSQRRELLRFGTPMENDKGEGMEGHRVRAVAVLEVRGPGGTRFVTGDILFRTTEAPPEHGSTGTSRDGAKAPARTRGLPYPRRLRRSPRTTRAVPSAGTGAGSGCSRPTSGGGWTAPARRPGTCPGTATASSVPSWRWRVRMCAAGWA